MKKKISRLAATLLVMVLMATVFTGCDKKASTHENSAAASQSTDSAYESKDIKVAALKGPTAIGMVKLMNDNEEKKTANNYTFQIEAAADAFTAGLIKGDVQIAAMPCNAAATLYNKSQGKISVVGINTLGVLYILDNKGEVKSVSDLKGKTIYTTGKGTTPEYTLRYLLSSNGIDPDKDVTIEFKSEAAEVAAIMASAKEETIAMLPQPFATTVLMKNQDVRIALDVTQEWEKTAKDGSSVVTGVIVVNTEYYNNNKAAVDKFLEEYRNSVDYVNANVDEASELVEKYDIETQEELAKKLEESGFAVTQATISRDIRQLKLTKVPKENGGSRYAVLQNAPSEVGSRYARVLKDAFISVDLAKNILVIKTVSGMAMAAAAAFDEMNWNEIVGCIGGDDTILCVARDDDAALVAAERLKKMVDGMEETGEEF